MESSAVFINNNSALKNQDSKGFMKKKLKTSAIN